MQEPLPPHRIFYKRQLTVSRRITTRANQCYEEIPAIVLSGKWLQEAGFESGQYIDVRPESGRLVITASGQPSAAESAAQNTFLLSDLTGD